MLFSFGLRIQTDALIAAIFLGLAAPMALAQEKPAADPSAFFAQHCQTCHEGAKPKGDFRLDSLKPDFADEANRERWLTVMEQLKSDAMPPKPKPRPPAKDVQILVSWIDAQATVAEQAQNAEKGRVGLRRLNRSEYANTILDLFKVSVDLNDLLPMDNITTGFDNSAESLHISSYLLDSYLEAADRVLDEAIASGSRPWAIDKRFDIKNERSIKPKGSVYRHLDDGVAIFSSWVSANIQVTLWQFQTRFRGKYRFKIAGYGYQTNKPVTFHIMAGPMNAAAQQYLIGYYELPANKPAVIEFVKPMEANHTIRIIADELGAIPPDVERVGSENYKGPGLVIQWVDVEGPILESWPPPSHQQIFGSLKQVPVANPNRRDHREVVSEQPLVDAERILRDFAKLAFRRPVTHEDIKPFLNRVKAKLDQKSSFEQAMRIGLKAVLVSPQFLFLQEKPGKLDDYALASRLSYFLWSSMPDQELFELANQNRLSQPETLRSQVERMLKDPKAANFTENFVGQWLSLRSIDATTPDYMLYPEYDDLLKESMVTETRLFFDEVLKNDLSLTNFVNSDFAILNGRLAKHYGIPGVDGLEFRKVKLPPESHRGGVLTMASVMKVTANGTTTSPILRGSWVLDRILGTPPPKPTVDVEAIEPDIRGATTIRDQLAKHRQLPECASCHTKIDPPGFALESFDVIGGWRDHYRSIGKGSPAVVNGRRMRYLNGPKVDASDTLPDGRKFANINEFKQLLLTDKDQLARALTEKLVTYATGATPRVSDRAEIEAIVRQLRDKNYGLRSLIHAITQSRIFQSK